MNHYFEDAFRRKCRKRLVNFIYQKIINTGYSRRLAAFVLNAWHFTLPQLTLLIYCFSPLPFGIFVLCGSFFFLGLFIYLKGCFISNIEYKLDNASNVNVIEPYLAIMGYPINNDTLYSTTLYLAFIYIAVTLVILYCRLKMRPCD